MKEMASYEVSEYAKAIDPDCPLDRWISFAVKVLRDAGIETYESCQGGPGHSYPEPGVRFHGTNADGFRAVAAAMTYGLPVSSLRRFWTMANGELTGPYWEITFRPFSALKRRQFAAEQAGAMERAATPLGSSGPSWQSARRAAGLSVSDLAPGIAALVARLAGTPEASTPPKETP